MATQTQIRRDTAANLALVTPALAELIYDTTNKRLGVGDGAQTASALDLYAVMNRDLHKMASISATAGGTADALTVTLDPKPSAYVAFMTILVKASANNTGAATINIEGPSGYLGAKAIKKNAGADDLGAGDIKTGGIYLLIYDGTAFQMISGAGGSVGAAPTYSVEGNAQNSGDAVIQSFASFDIGTADTERVVYIGFAASSTAGSDWPHALQVKVGDYATNRILQVGHNGTTDQVVGWAWVRVPTGATATVEITFDRTTVRCGIIGYSVVGPNDEVPISFTGTDVEPTVTPVRGVTGGVVMALSLQTNANVITWSGGVSEDLAETTIEGTVRYSAASAQLSANGTISPTGTWDGTSTFPAGAAIVVR